MNKLDSLWSKLAHFFEFGDLTPLAVLVSIAHYGPVLVAHGEHYFIAYVIGTLIDMLHFRTVRRAVTSWKWGEFVMAGFTTCMALAYHLRFYGYDWLLAIPIPVGIAILAYHASTGATTAENEVSKAQIANLQGQVQLLKSQNGDLQAEYKGLQKERKDLHDSCESLQGLCKTLQGKAETLEIYERRWNAVNQEFQTLILVNTGELSIDKARQVMGVKDLRTVESRAAKLNGVSH